MAEQPIERFLKDWGYFYKHERDYQKAENASLKLLEQARGQARAEVLAACIKAVHERWKENNGFNEAGPVLADLEDDIRALQPAASDLEANDDYVRKLRDMDWIREFPVVNEHWCPGFPEGVKPYLEALLRKERDGTEARLLCGNAECPERHLRIEWSEEERVCLGCLRDALEYQSGLKEGELKGRLSALRENPGLCNGDTDNRERHSRCCKYHQELSELEKARAEEKG